MAFIQSDILPIEQYSYLVFKDGIQFLELDNVYATGGKAMIVPSGNRIVKFRYFMQTETSIQHTDPISMQFNFIPGNYYYLDYELEKDNILTSPKLNPAISELPVSLMNEAQINFEKIKTFIAWPAANPLVLQGIWKGTGTGWGTKELTVTGNEFSIKLHNNIIWEGRCVYNDNWIILYPNMTYTIRGDERKNNPVDYLNPINTVNLAANVLYYERSGNNISITRISGGDILFPKKSVAYFYEKTK
jgi:hypothetical protein